MAGLIEKFLDYTVSRRSFIKGMAATTAGLSMVGCSNGLSEVSSSIAEKLANNEGEWITAACWHNCGGRCLNKALVVDGVVVRQKTDDTHIDSPDFPQQRGCPKGRSQRKQTFGVDRLKYPMKRKNWQPGGGNKELRGNDEWVRISWDEAIEIVASEIKRIKEKYGNESILASGGKEIRNTLSLAGGYVGSWGTTSWGAWFSSDTYGIMEGWYNQSINDRLDLRSSELIVLWGANPVWSGAGNPTYHYMQAKKAGAKFIVIDPVYTDTAEVLGDQWIPIRPATDHVMLLGMAYTLITEDDPIINPLIDWDFLKQCTIGFDAEQMPEGADPKGNFMDYVLGTYDGVPKTPQWASEICGVNPEVIHRLALEIAKTKKVALLTGWAPARVQNADSLPQMFMTFGAMTGHIGQPGRMTGVSVHVNTANGGHRLVKGGGDGLPKVTNPVSAKINDSELWDAILNKKYTAGHNDIRDINIQLIYHGYNAVLQTREGIHKGIAAHRQVEFVCTNAHFLTTNAKYSDVVLPATTFWEEEGGLLTGNREILIYYRRITEPLYEAKSDQWIAKEICKKLDLNVNDIYPINDKQQLFNKLAGAQVIEADGVEYEPLLTITDADIAEWGVQGITQQGRITLKEFTEKGIYQVSRSVGDNLGYIAFEAFRKDPTANPLKTASGKFEIFSQPFADLVKSKGWSEIMPIPAYNPAVEGYEATFADFKGKVKGDFPLQVINPHAMTRAHTVFANIPWLREAFKNEVYISTQDALERGISNGDTVLISSRHGKTLRIVNVTERVMPGVVSLPHGTWVEMDEKSGIDLAGSDNSLTNCIPTGQGIAGYNSFNVQVEKWNGKPLESDHKWPQRIIN